MVNTGRPSKGCATCKKRKIKCDEDSPACLQCKLAGWTCPGYPSASDLIFRNKTSAEMTQTGQVSSAWKKPVSPPVRDRASTFFIKHYVFTSAAESGCFPPHTNHEYLPALMQTQCSSFGLLSTAVAAIGYASLSNAANAPPWRVEAFRLYSSAVLQLREALQDPVQCRSDETLGAILLMGNFEIGLGCLFTNHSQMIVSADMTAMKSFSQHIMAAARCVELRRPQQFQSPIAMKLFMHMRRVLITTCHQLQEPIPASLGKWSQWTAPAQSDELLPINCFSEINEMLAGARAELRYQSITDPVIVAARLLPIDELFEEWARELPQSWSYTSYDSTNTPGIGRYSAKCDIYSDPWIACIWNCYRNIRLLIHEAIIVAALKCGTDEHEHQMRASKAVLASMSDGICHSAAYLLRDQPHSTEGLDKSTSSEGHPSPGGFLLIWPLFFAGMLRTSPTSQREWVASIIERIGLQSGLQLAMIMARMLRGKALSFSHDETFIMGEWHPN
ncbi:hypothetical protein CC79DRAFT_1275371 [Sarocladium strictum]